VPAASQPAVAVDAQAEAAEQIVLTIGDIGVSKHWIVTPNGSAPIGGSTWIARDMSRTESKIPTWAIVLAIVFAVFCLLGLFFLLVKEQQTTGYVEVSVQQGQLHHVTQIPLSNAQQVAQVRQLVYQAQSMAAAAR
jgi:ABC-type transport system involved in cytochrome c biogenesis permease subunit